MVVRCGVVERDVRTKEDVEAEMILIDAQIALFSLEIELEKKKLAFRELKEAWYSGRITLMQVLEEMMSNGGLCKRVGVWG